LEDGMVVIINMDSGPIVKMIALMPGEKLLQTKAGGQWYDMITIKPLKNTSMRKMKWREKIIPNDMVYVLGDNASVSEDSRAFGTVQMSQITRKVVDQRPYDPFAQHGWGDSSIP
jgi:type IV secretory pathway protease TraF